MVISIGLHTRLTFKNKCFDILEGLFYIVLKNDTQQDIEN